MTRIKQYSLQTPTPSPETVTVTLLKIGKGIVTINNQQITSITVQKGTQITLIATPDPGYKFSGWTMPYASSGIMNNPYTPYINWGGVITATFEPLPTQQPSTCNSDQFNIPLLGCQSKGRTLVFTGIGIIILYTMLKK